MPVPPFITLAPSAARTATGSGDPLDLTLLYGTIYGAGPIFPPQLRIQADVTAISGTAGPSITFTIEDSIDGGVTWNSIGITSAMTTVSKVVITIGIRGDAYPASFQWPFNLRRVRVRWVVGGTNPSLTSSVKAVMI